MMTGITTTMSEDSQAYVKLKCSVEQLNRWENDPWVIRDTNGSCRKGSFRDYVKERCPDGYIGLDSSLRECDRIISILSVFGIVQLDQSHSISVTHVVHFVKEIGRIISEN